MSKIEEEYNDIYGEVPIEQDDRIKFIKNKLKTDKSYANKLESEIERIKNIKWKTIKFTLYIVPKATPRPRLGGSGHFYVKGAKDNKKFFKEFTNRMADIPIISTPCKFYCTSYIPTPSSMRVLDQILAELGLIRPTSKPDFDNLVKTYSDMIQGILLFDDSLIVEGVSKKYYSVKPRIDITIKYMEDYDCTFNKNKIINKL